MSVRKAPTGHVIGATYESRYWGGQYKVIAGHGECGVKVECVVPGGGAHQRVGEQWTHSTALDRGRQADKIVPQQITTTTSFASPWTVRVEASLKAITEHDLETLDDEQYSFIRDVIKVGPDSDGENWVITRQERSEIVISWEMIENVYAVRPSDT